MFSTLSKIFLYLLSTIFFWLNLNAMESNTEEIVKRLHEEIENSNFAGIKACIERDHADPNLFVKGNNAFHAACIYGKVRIIKYLLPKMKDINSLSVRQRTALYLAIFYHHYKATQFLLRASATFTPIVLNTAINQMEKIKTDNFYPHYQKNQILTASKNIIDLLLYYGAEVNTDHYLDLQFDTLLQHALRIKYKELMYTLLRFGADPNQLDNLGRTAADYAVQNFPQAVKLLLEFNAAFSKKNNQDANAPDAVLPSPITIDLAGDFCRFYADTKKINLANQHPLHHAIQYRYPEFINEILKHQPEQLEATDSQGNTPLHKAMYQVNIPYGLQLLYHGAPLKVKNKEGKTPLDYLLTNPRPGPHLVRMLTHIIEPYIRCLSKSEGDMDAESKPATTQTVRCAASIDGVTHAIARFLVKSHINSTTEPWPILPERLQGLKKDYCMLQLTTNI